MDEDRTNKSPLEFIDHKTVVLSLDQDLCDYLENSSTPAADADVNIETERQLADISMALHQLMGLKAN